MARDGGRPGRRRPLDGGRAGGRRPEPIDSVPMTLRATRARSSTAARSGVVAPASTHGSATDASALSVASSAGWPASASRSATYRVLVWQTAHSARATATGSLPCTSGLCSGA